MTDQATPTPAPRSNRNVAEQTQGFLGILIPCVLVGLAVADFIRDGQIDKYLIGALLVFGLGALGWRIDVILEKYLERRGPPAA